MIRRRTILGLIVGLWAVGASAHQLPGSTATVVLRDGLVTIKANLEIEVWIRAQPAGDLTAMVAAAKKQATKLTVRVDGKTVPMTLEQFPSVAAIHALLQQPKPKAHGHHPKVVAVQWRATRAVPDAAVVTVNFPRSVGRVLVSFVEPRSRVVAPGATANFKSRRSPNRRTQTKKKR
ncbi:MAG: hypothetical protein ACI9OJ_000489 [Myxococcota bacterium]|jgi:hypothetical protein